MSINSDTLQQVSFFRSVLNRVISCGKSVFANLHGNARLRAVVSVLIMLQFNRMLKELDEIRTSMRTLSNSLSMALGEGAFLAQDFVAGTISLGKLSEAMRLGKLGEQIVLKSEVSFSRIRFVGAEPADAETYYEKKIVRDREARRAYRKTRQSSDGINELYMLDIMREGMTYGYPRLR